MTSLAVKSTIQVAEIVLEVFRLPDGTFFFNQTQSANSVKKPERSIRDFYKSKRAKSLLDRGFTSANIRTLDAAAGFVSAAPVEPQC